MRDLRVTSAKYATHIDITYNDELVQEQHHALQEDSNPSFRDKYANKVIKSPQSYLNAPEVSPRVSRGPIVVTVVEMKREFTNLISNQNVIKGRTRTWIMKIPK